MVMPRHRLSTVGRRALAVHKWSGTPCRTTSMHRRTMSPLDSAWKPGFSPDTSVFSALVTFVIIALYKSTFTIPYQKLFIPRLHIQRRQVPWAFHCGRLRFSRLSVCHAVQWHSTGTSVAAFNNTHTHFYFTQVSRYQKGKTNLDFYWNKRQWVAVTSTGPYASLHLAPDRQPCQHPTTQFFYRPDALPAAQPTASKHWRTLDY